MSARTRIALAAAVAALSLAVVAAPASADTTIGQTGGGNLGCGGPLSIADTNYIVPAGGGTITSFSIRSIAADAGRQLAFLVLRPTSTPNSYTVVGRSGLVTQAGTGLETFTLPANIPVQSGDILGFRLNVGNLFENCGRAFSGGLLVLTFGALDPSVGDTVSFTITFTELHLNLSANLVPTPTYSFTGFFSPVNNPTDPEPVNSVKAGQSVPVKFSLGGDQGLDVLDEEESPNPKLVFTQCDPDDEVDPLEETSTANNGLTYNALTDTYSYVWKTVKAWKGKCGTLTVKLDDGSEHTANFEFK
jgi:hypothetical protein